MTSTTSKRTIVAGLTVIAIAAPLAACGGSSSKPAYCTDKNTLQADIKSIPNDLKSGGIGSLQTSLPKIETDAQTLVASAKSDFPSETSAMQTSIDGLKTSAKALGSSPSPQELLALIPQATAAVSSVQAFEQAASSKCK